MTLLPVVTEVQLRLPGLAVERSASNAVEVPEPEVLVPSIEQLAVVEDVADVEELVVRTPLAIIGWAAAAVGGSLVFLLVLLLLGPLLGPPAGIAATVWVVRRYERAGDAVGNPTDPGVS